MSWLETRAWGGARAACLTLTSSLIPAVRGPVTPSPCGQIEYRSQTGGRYSIVTIIWAICLITYGSAIRCSLAKAQVKLQGQPYNCYQFANLLALWQVRSARDRVMPPSLLLIKQDTDTA